MAMMWVRLLRTAEKNLEACLTARLQLAVTSIPPLEEDIGLPPLIISEVTRYTLVYRRIYKYLGSEAFFFPVLVAQLQSHSLYILSLTLSLSPLAVFLLSPLQSLSCDC
jgi:hypothetical protein